MFKKTITYKDYGTPPQDVTEDFYFNLTQLELAEQDLYAGGFEELARKLTETSDGPKAYEIFKSLILSTYGKKGEDNRKFYKKDPVTGRPYSEEFEASPALAEMIIEFLKDPSLALQFVRECLPAHVVEEAERDENQPQLPIPQDHLRKHAAPVAPTQDAVPTSDELAEFKNWKENQQS